jgi:hypothetical protein
MCGAMRKEILLSIFVGVLLVSFYFGVTFIKADQDTDLGQLITEKKLDLGTVETYKIAKYRKSGQDYWVISRQKNRAEKVLPLSGFEDEVNQCERPLITVNGIKTICLKGAVGVHSQNLELVSIETLESINFQDGEEQYSSVVSDVPSFQIKDDVLFVDMRNYDTDPLLEATRLSFDFSDGKFVFDKKENITYDGNNNSLLGVI